MIMKQNKDSVEGDGRAQEAAGACDLQPRPLPRVCKATASLLFAFEAAEDEAAAPPPQPAATRATVRVSTMARRYFQICLMDNI